MTTRRVVLSAATVESLEVDVLVNADPSATAPAFALTDVGTYATTATSFTNGAWTGTYVSGQWLTARTPTLGGSLSIATGQNRWLWIKVVAGSPAESAVWLVGTVSIV